MSRSFRELFVPVHVSMAGFFLPLALLFAITGALYAFDIKGNYKNAVETVSFELAEEPRLSELQAASEAYLMAENVSRLPTGAASIKRAGTSWQFEWTGTAYDFLLEPTSESKMYKVTIKNTTWHRYLVQLHKAKGGLPFKILSAAFSIVLIFIFFSGAMMALASPELKKNLYFSFFLGVVTFTLFAFLS